MRRNVGLASLALLVFGLAIQEAVHEMGALHYEIAGIYMDNPEAKAAAKIDDDGRAVRDAAGEPLFEVADSIQ